MRARDAREQRVTDRARFFPEDEIIVSKTDLKGRITYVNQTFITVADFTEEELLGQPHSVIRHPDMPRCVFKLLWDTLEAKRNQRWEESVAPAAGCVIMKRSAELHGEVAEWLNAAVC